MIVSDPSWPVPIPEYDWTPSQRAFMRAEQVGYIRQRQQLRLASWTDRQKQTREWICFADIADWCARSPGGIGRDENLRAQAMANLLQSISTGEFNRQGRLCVAYVPPWQLVCPDPIRFRLPSARPHPAALTCCWAPQKLWARWFAVRADIPQPPWVTVHEEPPAARRGRGSGVDRAFRRWVATRDKPPTSRECDAWAKDNNYSTGIVRQLRTPTPRGRPRKNAPL